MVKLHVFGNNSKIVNNIRNLTGYEWSAQQDLTTTMKSINIFKIWWKKGNNFKMGN
jgi:hypothetical protein